MLTHPLAERLRSLGMAAMADAFLEMQSSSAAADLTREDWLGLLLDREVTARDNKRLGRRLSRARLRQTAVVEDTDFRTPRGLDRALFHKLAGCDWIRHSQHLLIGGPTGTGKSWLACALGHKACREGFSVLYRRAPRLFVELATARGEGRLPRMLATLERTRLLIIDDWGPEPLTAEQRRDMLEIVEDRYEKGSLLMTSQIAARRSLQRAALGHAGRRRPFDRRHSMAGAARLDGDGLDPRLAEPRRPDRDRGRARLRRGRERRQAARLRCRDRQGVVAGAPAGRRSGDADDLCGRRAAVRRHRRRRPQPPGQQTRRHRRGLCLARYSCRKSGIAPLIARSGAFPVRAIPARRSGEIGFGERMVLVRACEPATADHVRDQDRRDFPGLAHGAPSERLAA